MKRYICPDCGKTIVPAGNGYWRHVRAPRDGHVPPVNQRMHADNFPRKIANEVIEYALDPTMYKIKKGVQIANGIVNIVKKISEDE